MDMAVGIIIGGAFGKIVTSLVNDVVLPVIGQFTGGVDFSNLFINLSAGAYESLAAAEEAGAAVLKYGAFIQSVLDFAIIAFVIFMMIRMMNSWKKQEEEEKAAAPPEPSDEVKLLTEIRDSLKSAS